MCQLKKVAENISHFHHNISTPILFEICLLERFFVLTMGLPEDVSVIAWGLSLERPTMIMFGIDNIRDLFGSKMQLHSVKNNQLCPLGLEK